MLNVYISADLEGVSNVVYPHQTMIEGGESYYTSIRQQHKELNYIITALCELNVDKVTVNDAHGSMENLKLNELNSKVELITGKPKPVSMMSGLDESYSCVFFMGYHSKASSLKGVLAHTFSEKYSMVKINGKAVGEIELNAIYAGNLNVPIALVTGDDITCNEAVDSIGNVYTVSSKIAISTTSAKCKPQEIFIQELISAVKSTINTPKNWIVHKQSAPYTLELHFKERRSVDLAELLPCIERISATAISYTSDNYAKIYKLLQFLTATV